MKNSQLGTALSEEEEIKRELVTAIRNTLPTRREAFLPTRFLDRIKARRAAERRPDSEIRHSSISRSERISES
jgi:hypothetical protein